MTKGELHNALRVMIGIDRHELEAAGIGGLDNVGVSGWDAFRDDPFRWFIHASDADADKLWSIIERRMGER